MSDGVGIVILGEDERHRMLIRKHLRKRGYSHRKLRDALCAPTQTLGISFVKAQYPVEVAALRSKAFRVTTALVVAIDADDETVEDRLRQLDDLLGAAGQKRRQDGEHIAIVVPRRNVETWMYFLAGNTVDEETDYKSQCKSLNNGDVATAFAAYTYPRRELPQDCPSSLQYACEVELPRLP